MNFNQLIKNWHDKAGQDDIFSSYVFEYLAFIAYLKRVKFIDKNSDSGAIRALKNSKDLRDLYLSEIKNNKSLRESWMLIKAELDKSALGVLDENTDEVKAIKYWDCDCQNITNLSNRTCEQQGKIRNLDDWKNMVEFWHSIRNNLFHGAKDSRDDRDKILIKGGFDTLRPLVEILLKK